MRQRTGAYPEDVATLEEKMGVLLLDRAGKQFKLTASDAPFLVYAQKKLLELQREAKHEMCSSETMAVSIRIGAIESVLHSWLIPWLEKRRAEHPGLELELTVDGATGAGRLRHGLVAARRGRACERLRPSGVVGL